MSIQVDETEIHQIPEDVHQRLLSLTIKSLSRAEMMAAKQRSENSVKAQIVSYDKDGFEIARVHLFLDGEMCGIGRASDLADLLMAVQNASPKAVDRFLKRK